MRKIKKLGILTLCCLGLFTLVACNRQVADNENVLPSNETSHLVEVGNQDLQEVEIHLDHRLWGADELDAFVDWSTDVIRGVVLDERVDRVNVYPTQEAVREFLISQGLDEDAIEYRLAMSSFEPHYEVSTIYLIEVLEVFQGDIEVGDVIEVIRSGGEYNGEFWFIREQITLEPGREFVFFLIENFDGFPYALAAHNQGVYRVPIEIIAENEDLIDSDHLDLELDNVGVADPIVITIEDLIEIAEENDLLD